MFVSMLSTLVYVGKIFYSFWFRPVKIEEDPSHYPEVKEEEPERPPEKVRMVKHQRRITHLVFRKRIWETM